VLHLGRRGKLALEKVVSWSVSELRRPETPEYIQLWIVYRRRAIGKSAWTMLLDSSQGRRLRDELLLRLPEQEMNSTLHP
jgi:hypothetical protein